jgi:hypothetical protein
MALTCPKCDKTNNCNCSNCEATENLVIIDYENDLYQCCHCGHKFDEQDSLDHDWDKLMQRFYTEITPKMCLEWISVIGKERKKLEEKYGSFGFECSFAHHFNMSYKDCNKETYNKLLIQVNRDIQLDTILESK